MTIGRGAAQQFSRAMDRSEGGLFLRTEDDFFVGDELELRIGDPAVLERGVVVRTVAADDAHGRAAGIGVKILPTGVQLVEDDDPERPGSQLAARLLLLQGDLSIDGGDADGLSAELTGKAREMLDELDAILGDNEDGGAEGSDWMDAVSSALFVDHTAADYDSMDSSDLIEGLDESIDDSLSILEIEALEASFMEIDALSDSQVEIAGLSTSMAELQGIRAEEDRSRSVGLIGPEPPDQIVGLGSDEQDPEDASSTFDAPSLGAAPRVSVAELLEHSDEHEGIVELPRPSVEEEDLDLADLGLSSLELPAVQDPDGSVNLALGAVEDVAASVEVPVVEPAPDPEEFDFDDDDLPVFTGGAEPRSSQHLAAVPVPLRAPAAPPAAPPAGPPAASLVVPSQPQAAHAEGMVAGRSAAELVHGQGQGHYPTPQIGVLFEGGGIDYGAGRSVDASVQGLVVGCRFAPPINERLRIKLQSHDGGPPILMVGLLVWRAEGAIPGFPAAFGVRILEFDRRREAKRYVGFVDEVIRWNERRGRR